MSKETKSWVTIMMPTIQAFRTYWHAIALIQMSAFFLVVAYYQVPAVQNALGSIAQLKSNWGPMFAAIATMVSGGLIPEAVKRILRPAHIKPPGLREFAHQLVFWVLIGLLVDYFYQLQAIIFGDGTDPGTLIKKVLVDLLMFTPGLSLPFTAVWFMIWECGYSLKGFKIQFSVSEVALRTLRLWTICLIFWPVMLLIIYSLPQLLQFPLFLFGNAAYSILMIFVVRKQSS